MDILIEDLDESLWAVAIDKKNKIQNLEIDPFSEIIRWGSIYMARVARIDAANNAAYVDLGFGFDGFLAIKDVRIDGAPPAKGKKIGQVLRSGEMIMVQVKTPHNPTGQDQEDEGETKASRVTMDIAFAGRFLIYTPFSDENRISKRIENKELRDSLKAMLKDIKDIHGCILRSSAAHCQTDILVREGKILKAIWDNVILYDGEDEPTLLMLGANATQRMLGDLAAEQVGRIVVSDPNVYEDTQEWCDLFAPDLMTKIDLHEVDNTRSGMGLFEIHDLIGQFENILNPYMSLPSGGSIIIEETTAMTVIDVNSGSDKNPLNANLEAAKEIARQIRIRNLGGIIMADFITMKTATHRKKVTETLTAALANDPCTATCHGITKLGVFEISRQRRMPTLEDKLIMLDLDDGEDY